MAPLASQLFPNTVPALVTDHESQEPERFRVGTVIDLASGTPRRRSSGAGIMI